MERNTPVRKPINLQNESVLRRMVPGCTRKLSRELWFQRRSPLRSPTGECRRSGVPWGGRQGGLQFRPPGESRLEIRFCRCHSGRKIRLRRNGKQHGRSGEVYCSQGCTVGPLVVGCHGGSDGTLDESHIRGKRCTMAL